MTTAVSPYHQQVAAQKRRVIVDAATDLFLDLGYDKASLARIAERAGVSKATLFKQFPTKALLFDAIVREFWAPENPTDLMPAVGDLTAGLTVIGRRYVALLTRPRMTDLFRIVIAEAPRFPELGQMQFALGKLPFFDSVRTYLEAERAAGSVRISDSTMAATQFLAMIADFAFWPRLLLLDWAPNQDALIRAVTEAVTTMEARYRVT